jgi:hypothetical protein
MSKEITQDTIGKLLKGEFERDAIHIAVLPVICDDEYLSPGDSIGLIYGSTERVKYRDSRNGSIGVVDPYLREGVRKGEKFWMFINPNTITGLRHQWHHPVIDASQPAPLNGSEVWLRQFADRWNFDYDEMIATASIEGIDNDYNFITAQGVDLHSREELGEDHDLFWQHLEALTGKKFDIGHRMNLHWSCSC